MKLFAAMRLSCVTCSLFYFVPESIESFSLRINLSNKHIFLAALSLRHCRLLPSAVVYVSCSTAAVPLYAICCTAALPL